MAVHGPLHGSCCTRPFLYLIERVLGGLSEDASAGIWESGPYHNITCGTSRKWDPTYD